MGFSRYLAPLITIEADNLPNVNECSEVHFADQPPHLHLWVSVVEILCSKGRQIKIQFNSAIFWVSVFCGGIWHIN